MRLRGREVIEPDWYADPADAGLVRWHDGTDWTEKSQPVMQRLAQEQVELLRTIKDRSVDHGVDAAGTRPASRARRRGGDRGRRHREQRVV